MISLPDPRRFPQKQSHTPHPLLNLLTKVMRGSSVLNRLQRRVEDLLLADRQDVLDDAFAQATSAQDYCILDSAVAEILRQPLKALPRYANIFAMPLVFVVNSKFSGAFSTKLDDAVGPKALLEAYRLLTQGGDCYFSPQLAEVSSLTSVTPCQVYRWRQTLQSAAQGLPVDLSDTTEVVANQEQVLLRYIIGLSIQRRDQPQVIRMNSLCLGVWANEMARNLSYYFSKQGLITAVCLPRHLQSWYDAIEDGIETYHEVSLHRFVSNTLKVWRQREGKVVAIIAAYDDATLHLTLQMQQPQQARATWVWPLSLLSNLWRIEQSMMGLLRDYHVSEVEVVAEVLSAMVPRLPCAQPCTVDS